MPEALLELPTNLEDGEALADWAEALMILEERESIPRAELHRRLGDATDSTLSVGLLLEEVRIRERRASRSYPFTRTEAGIGRNEGVNTLLYEFLLWSSIPQSPVRKKREYRPIDRFFDRVVLKALLAYFGRSARGLRFGTPASDGRPRGFSDALHWLADLMSIDRTGLIPPNDHKNDAGVDVIAWLPFGDDRADFMVAIAQCTMETAWPDKANQLVAAAEAWGGGWLPLGRAPVTALAVPFTMSASHDRFNELRRIINLILDRIRLCELLDGPYDADVAGLERWAAVVRRMMLHPPIPERAAKPART
jgi:hypothetical protein